MPKSALKRKIKSRKGANLKKNANLKKKRKEKWSVEDIPSLDISIDLDTPPHLLSVKSFNQNKPLAESKNIENETGQMANVSEFRADEAINENTITNYVVGTGDVGDDKQHEIQTIQSSTQSPTADFQNENDDFFAIGQRTTIGENENNEEQGEISRENAGEQILALDIEVFHSPMLTPRSNRTQFTDNESILNVTMSSLDEYCDNGNQSDSNEESSHESLDTEVTQQKESRQKINITDLINGGNTMWDEVIERYKKDGTLSKKHRKAVIEAIVQYARVKKIYIDNPSMKDISFQLCNIFPTENPTTYFVMIGTKPSGQLYYFYHRKRSEDAKLERERVQPEETLLEPTESIDILKNDGHDDNVYIQKWRETFVYRQKKILKYESYDDFLNEWPIIERRIGSILISLDKFLL